MNMLQGSNVFLRKLEHDDLTRCLLWINDPEMFITMGVWGPRSKNEQDSWYKALEGSKTNIVFALCLKEGDSHIGNVSLFDIDYRSRNAGLTVMIPDRAHQGCGYGREAIKILCTFAFEYLNLHKLYCKTDNPYAAKMYEKIGFVKEGILRKHTFRYGKYVDKILYGILAEDFNK
jgi:RimJ/RimL family protein N-acetyltransferase